MMEKRIPDFQFLPWRLNRTSRLISEDGFLLGCCLEFINEWSGDIGVRFAIRGIDNPILSWEENSAAADKIARRYVAWREKSEWRRLRVRSHNPDRVIKENFHGRVNVTFHFVSSTGEEFPIRYSIRI